MVFFFFNRLIAHEFQDGGSMSINPIKIKNGVLFMLQYQYSTQNVN